MRLPPARRYQIISTPVLACSFSRVVVVTGKIVVVVVEADGSDVVVVFAALMLLFLDASVVVEVGFGVRTTVVVVVGCLILPLLAAVK